MFISTILPRATVNPTTERGSSPANATTPVRVDQRAPLDVPEPLEADRPRSDCSRPTEDSRPAWACRPGVGAEHNVRVEHRQERVEVAVAGGSEERVDEFPLRGEICVGGGCRSETAASAAGELSRRGL
jgi:hypothetical protein